MSLPRGLRGWLRLRSSSRLLYNPFKTWRALSRSMNDRGSVPRLRLPHGVPDLGAAVGAFINEVDLRHAPMRLDVPNKHGQHSNAAGTDDRSRLSVLVLVTHVGWHIGSPSKRKQRISTRTKPIHVRDMSVINSCEQTRNGGVLSLRVAFL